MGLANGSYGMGILDSVFEKGAGATGAIGEDWSDVLRVLMTGKVRRLQTVLDISDRISGDTSTTDLTFLITPDHPDHSP
jgi:hypothetical protein